MHVLHVQLHALLTPTVWGPKATETPLHCDDNDDNGCSLDSNCDELTRVTKKMRLELQGQELQFGPGMNGILLLAKT